MSNEIHTAAELDALPPNSVVIDGWGIAWQKVLYAEPQCWVSWLNPGESSKWLLTRGPSTLLYRPDQPDEATQPSGEQVAPSVDEVVTTMQVYLGNASVTGKWGAAARAVGKLYGSQPTVAQVRAGALREAADEMDNTDDPDAIYVSNGDIDLWLRARADRIESEATA